MRVLLLDHHGDEHVVGIDRDQVGVLHQIDVVGEQEAQRRLRQRIDVLRRQLAVAHHDRLAVGDELDRARADRIRSAPAGLLRCRTCPGVRPPSGPTWTNLPISVCIAGEIVVDPLDDGALLGVERAGRARLAEQRGERIGDRIGRRLRRLRRRGAGRRAGRAAAASGRSSVRARRRQRHVLGQRRAAIRRRQQCHRRSRPSAPCSAAITLSASRPRLSAP